MDRRILLVSDVDDTLTGDDQARRRLNEFWPSIRDRVELALASGRFCDSVAKDVESLPLPQPVAIIGGVGSEIRSYPEGRPNDDWIQRISDHWSAEQARNILADEEILKLQPEIHQSKFKLSYFLHNATAAQLDRLQSKLYDAGVDSSVIYSSQRDLDFLPSGVNKGTAAAFLARSLEFDLNRVIVAGNSANDAKLFEHDFYGIIVANAHDELKAYARQPKVYLSRYSHADGVRDGLEFWLSKLDQADDT